VMVKMKEIFESIDMVVDFSRGALVVIVGTASVEGRGKLIMGISETLDVLGMSGALVETVIGVGMTVGVAEFGSIVVTEASALVANGVTAVGAIALVTERTVNGGTGLVN
jgi:hypothetical protein